MDCIRIVYERNDGNDLTNIVYARAVFYSGLSLFFSDVITRITRIPNRILFKRLTNVVRINDSFTRSIQLTFCKCCDKSKTRVYNPLVIIHLSILVCRVTRHRAPHVYIFHFMETSHCCILNFIFAFSITRIAFNFVNQ